jgi:hypothetical protein
LGETSTLTEKPYFVSSILAKVLVYEQEIVSGHSGWYEAEGWLPPRLINLGGSDFECGVGDHPFSSIMIAMGKSGRFQSVNVLVPTTQS